MKKTFLILAALSFIFSNNIFSQTYPYEFLRLDMSARAGALAGSFISNNDDANVIFYNPAGLKLLSESPISFSFAKHLLDINLASISYSTQLFDIGRIGAAVKYINYGSFTSSDEFGTQGEEFGAGDVVFILGYANELDVNFYYGANVKVIYSSIEKYSSSALAADLGLHYAFPEQLINIGFSILNLGSQLSSYAETKEDLPLDIAFGLSKRLEHLPLRLSLDFHKLNEEREDFVQHFKAFTVGAEFSLSKVLRLRLGYDNEKRSELKVGSFAGIAGFNIGLGAIISDYNFDYGFSSWGAIGAIHRISVSTAL